MKDYRKWEGIGKKMKPTDYENLSNWLYLDTERLHETDLLYFYPTMLGGSGTETVSEICNEMRDKASLILKKQAAYLIEFTNVFAPLYRQLTLTGLTKGKNEEETLEIMRSTEVRADVYAFLDLYFHQINQGRPFILAGHSQGAIVIQLILSDYMKEHPEYLKRMVAAYAIGYGVTEAYLKKNTHLKFAEGKSDTGVIISWNTEGPGGQTDSLVLPKGSIAINPLNWKRDETYASVKENRGSLIEDPETLQNLMVPGRADATVSLERGSVICTTVKDYIPKGLFGDCSLHNQDWLMYLENIRQNMLDRITAYLGHRPLVGKPLDYSEAENWLFCESEGKHPVDLFYLYPTVIRGGDGDICGTSEKSQKDAAVLAFSASAGAFESFANVYVPVYRQVTKEAAKNANSQEQYTDLLRIHEGVSDVFAALDYFFKYLNQGRPFLFAGQGQGSALLGIVLGEYMKKHPEYLKRMVAAYVPGYRFDREYFRKNPQLKGAEGENDTGVIISWNTEGPGASSGSETGRDIYVINPINWKTDDTAAPAANNAGSMIRRTYSNLRGLVPGFADARIDPERGSLVSTAQVPYSENENGFGSKSLHQFDWALFYENIRINAEKRTKGYLNEYK